MGKLLFPRPPFWRCLLSRPNHFCLSKVIITSPVKEYQAGIVPRTTCISHHGPQQEREHLHDLRTPYYWFPHLTSPDFLDIEVTTTSCKGHCVLTHSVASLAIIPWRVLGTGSNLEFLYYASPAIGLGVCYRGNRIKVAAGS